VREKYCWLVADKPSEQDFVAAALWRRILHGGGLLVMVVFAHLVSFPDFDHVVSSISMSWVWFAGGSCGCASSSLSSLCEVVRRCWGLKPTGSWVVTYIDVPNIIGWVLLFFSFFPHTVFSVVFFVLYFFLLY
jgi:hypothetical protein